MNRTRWNIEMSYYDRPSDHDWSFSMHVHVNLRHGAQTSVRRCDLLG